MAAKAHTRSAKSTMGSNSDDVIRGTELDDVIKGRPGDDHLFGEGGDDVLKGGPGNDILDGGSGDDLLIGGPGEDTFVFDFNISNDGGGGLLGTFTPISGWDWDTFFLEYFVKFLGSHIGEPGGKDQYLWVDYEDKDPLADNPDPTVESYTLSDGTVIYYENDLYATGGEGAVAILTSDGHDTIASFQSGVNVQDTIQLNGLSGLTDQQLDDLFDLATVDTDGDGVEDASVLSWGDGAGSITIGGTTEWGTDVLAFFSDDQVFLA
ncbi:hypothetical protein [Sedimentimonas flavescens]|uniref:hypothetical protein n=1 Tax=Sedimentimonas flavescens TaxID=2851012 RepID=UPI001C4A74D0|nr:hypothetical protein [Sedimentimonas flavescens]MBW0157089.1 hypothetical protein [Sedimentimonas flavescens]